MMRSTWPGMIEQTDSRCIWHLTGVVWNPHVHITLGRAVDRQLALPLACSLLVDRAATLAGLCLAWVISGTCWRYVPGPPPAQQCR